MNAESELLLEDRSYDNHLRVESRGGRVRIVFERYERVVFEYVFAYERLFVHPYDSVLIQTGHCEYVAYLFNKIIWFRSESPIMKFHDIPDITSGRVVDDCGRCYLLHLGVMVSPGKHYHDVMVSASVRCGKYVNYTLRSSSGTRYNEQLYYSSRNRSAPGDFDEEVTCEDGSIVPLTHEIKCEMAKIFEERMGVVPMVITVLQKHFMNG